jgi:hypothetical protein
MKGTTEQMAKTVILLKLSMQMESWRGHECQQNQTEGICWKICFVSILYANIKGPEKYWQVMALKSTLQEGNPQK